MSFAPQTEAFAVTVADTAVVGEGIKEEYGSALKYTGVNSMVGTLISWKGENGGYNLHSTAHMSSVWVIDNKGEMVNGANSTRCPPINFYSKKNDNLSAVKLIAGKNATPEQNASVAKKDELYEGETFNNITKGTFNGKEGVNYFTVGGKDASPQDISSDWAKAIFAASLYSNSGILDNEDFGGKKADEEYPTGWIPEYQAITKRDGTGNADYVTKFGTPFNSQLLEKNKAGDYNYIAIKLESDWTATDVSKIEDKEKDADNEPIGVKTHIGRLSNGVKDNNPNGDTLIPLGTTFDANYDQHIIEDIDTGTVYRNSVYTNGKVDTTSSSSSTDPVALSERIKNYATTYNREVRTQQLTFCPAGEGYSFGRLAIPDNAYVILDLNGHTIDRALNENDANLDTILQSVFILGQYARLEVFDSSVSEAHPFGTGTVKGGYTKNGTGKVFDNQIWDNYGSDSNYANSVKGGGFTLRNRAELTVHSGNVTDNQGLFGGAFYGVGASTVNVFDANVEGNSAVRGGMCYLSQGSFMTLNMFGGLVQGNSARMDGFAETNDHDCARRPSVTDPSEMTDEGIYDTQILKNPDGYAHEGGGICVYQESYCNIYGGTITHNYSATFGGGISVSYNSFLKLFGGEITGNVAKGMVRKINGAKVVSVKDPKQTETPEANVGGAGINMYQDSAGIYLNGPAKVMGNYCSQKTLSAYTAEAIAALIESDGDKEDSNLYLSLTTSMARYSWNSDSKKYEESKTRYNLTGEWDEEYGPTFKTTPTSENKAVTRKGQMKFDPKQHLYPEIKVQGPLYRDANHVAQVSITPAAGVEAGGYIMRQFYPQGWEDGTEGNKQTSDFNGTNGPRPLKSGAEGTIDESSHAKNQINANGGTTFNLREFLKTGATSGYVDGFLFTDGGTSIVAGTGDDDGWYLALGTRQEGNLPVKWQYYDSTVDPKTNKPYGWLDATTSAESGTGFTLVYNGTDRKYDIRVFVDRTKLTSDESGVTSGYFYLYYDYYTVADETGKETEPEADGTAKKHYLYASDADKNSGKYTNILYITSGYDDSDMEIVQDKGVIYASERYDILGYRFTIRADAKDLKGAGDGTATPFNEKDDFVANPNYATMKIERATLMVSQIKLADITRYYDGTRDFYIPSTTITAGTLTGQAPNDQSKLLMKFSGESDGYVHGTLSSPNVGTNNVSLGVIIEELGGEDHEGHNKNTFPDKCLLANYMLYDLNTETTYPAEDREEMSVTLNVNVQPKPITVELEKQSYEYGSVPIFGTEWGTHSNTANWAETYSKANGGASLEALFNPAKVPGLGEEGFDPNKLGTDGKLAQIDIDTLGVDDEHGGILDKDNLPLRLDQILKISFNSVYSERSSVNTYDGSFSYTNNNYDVTWKFNGEGVPGMSGGSLSPAQITGLIEITKRKINATIPDAASIYGEAQETLTLPDEKITHASGVGDGLVFGDSLSATLDLANAEKVKTSQMLRATVDAEGKPVNGTGHYDIVITNEGSINPNYELVTVTKGKYVVYPRKIVLKAGDYSSVYGDPVNTGKMGGFTSSLAAEQKEGLHTSSTVILPVDEAAFNKGVSYAYSDTGEHKNKGEYKFNVKFDHEKATEGDEDIGINYDVSYDTDATHTIAARQVVVLIASPATQASEYGEEPVVQQGNGTGIYWLPQYTVNGTNQKVVLDEDWEGFRAGIKLYVAEAVNSTAPAGKYPLMGKYSGSANYKVSFRGMWTGDVAEKYKDSAFGEIVDHAGTYTITRRNIQLNMSTALTSEYGDDLMKFWESGAYTFSRADGKGAIVNGDVLTFAPSLFYIQVPSSSPIYGGDGNEAFSRAQLPADTYSVIFDGTAYKASDAYSLGDNANYEISENRGRYTVSKRALTVKIGATVDGEFNQNPTIEYGNAVPERMAQITRTSSKEGDGFIGTDGQFITDYLATTNSINNYTSSLTTSGHLRIGVYEFTVPRNEVSNNYDVTWEFGSLTVTQRVVHVTVKEQTSVYTGIEPNVSNDEWALADGYSLATGDERSIVKLDKEDGFNAGKYDITLSCTDNNYKFVVDDEGHRDENNLIATQKYVITPAKITFSLSGDSMIYDAQSHLLDFYFSGDGVTPANHTLQGQEPTAGPDGSVTFTFTDGLYTVTITYTGEFGGKVVDANNYKNVGSYTVTITLKNVNSFGDAGYEGNFCFEETAGISRISTGEYVYESSKTYEITKATIYIPDLASKAYTRDEQEADWNFANDLNTTVVPDKSNYNYTYGSGYVKYDIKMDGGEYADTNSRLGDKRHLPYYRGTYTFTLTLTDDDYKNFMFEGDERSVTLDFEITPLEILSSLAETSAEYDDKSRFHGDTEDGRLGAWSFRFSSTTETSVEGISYNILYKYTGLGATGEDRGEHTLIVKVGGYEHAGSHERVATQYFVDDVEHSINEARMKAILADLRAFINAGTYTYTLTFEYKNFLLRATSGSGTVEELEYTYTITPVLLSVGAFAEKEFNNEEQDADVTSATFIPTSTMTPEEAYALLQKDGNSYELSYEPYLDADDNGRLGVGGKPVNASTYTVTVKLKGGNFAFSTEGDGSYLYTDSSQRFVIKPFNIGTLFSHSDEGDDDHGDHPEHLASTAFVGELNGETTMAESGVTLYVYTYTGQEIKPELVKATIYLTADSKGIEYTSSEDLAANFSLGSFLDNVYTDIVTKNHASLVVTGRGNYTGNTQMSFSIVPMELTAKIGEANSAYGEPLNLTSDLITYEEGSTPYELDDLKFSFTLVGQAERNGHVVAGKYAIKAVCGNLNYKVTFKGDWNEAGDDTHNDKCGIYTVDRRQILVKIENQSTTYSGSKPTVNSARPTYWNALSAVNGTGNAIVTGDEDLKITLYLNETPAKWDVGSYTIKGTLEEDDIGKNYEVQWEDGAFEITAVKVTVKLKPQESVYDGAIPKAQQGAEWYVTGGSAVDGENLDDYIEIYIVNEDKRAFEYQLSGRLKGTENYAIEFTQSTYTIKPRAIVVTVKDAESYYGEKEVVLDSKYWFAELVDKSLSGTAIIGGDDLEIQLRKEAGSSAGTYTINTTWNNNGNYTVEFKSESHGATSAVYTVKARPIVIYINDQKGVYGSINTDTLSQDEGERAAWYVKGFAIEGESLTGDYVIAGNRLNITLNRDKVVKPGKYKITGHCGNENYAVTWEGGWEGDEVSGKGDAGLAGTYTIEKRKVTITVLTQYGTYGEDKRVSSNLNTAYTVECTNAGDGMPFVPADSVTLQFAIDDEVNTREVAIGKYPVYLTIKFGETDHEDWYVITVKEDGVLQEDGRYKVENAYEVERRKLRVTISDLTSVYGDEVKAPTYGTIISTNVSGNPILEKDDAAIKAQILAKMQIMVGGVAYDFRSKPVIEVDTYQIVGTKFVSDDGNYEIEFIGNNGDNGVYTVVKRDVSVTLQNETVTYGDIGDYKNDAELKAKIDAALAEKMTVASTNGTQLNVAAVNGDDLGIQIYIYDPQVSTSGHLKQGQYFIYGTYSTEEKISRNYNITVIWAHYTVEARAVTVRLATNNPTSEYGDPITDQSGWGYEASLTNGEGTAIFEGDIVEFTMATTLKAGDPVQSGLVNATLDAGENDNANYNITFVLGSYSIVQRRIVIVVDKIEPVVYGTPWEMPTYTAKRADGEGKAILDEGEVEIVIDVQNPQKSATGFLRWKEGGYSLTADVTGTKQGNYSVTIENIGTVKYVVEKLAITIAIEDAESVYGEAFADLQWKDTQNKTVQGNGKKDDLQIELRRVGEAKDVGLYPISGECRNTDYNVTFEGSWENADAYQGKCGTYKVTQREVRLTVSNQSHAIYGETITIREPVIGSTLNYADGNRYTLAAGDRIASVVELYLLTQKPDTEWDTSSRLDAGNYPLCVRGIDKNYNIVMEAEGNFLVNERVIHVHIGDQHGVYGDANAVAQDNYTVTNGNGTGSAIVKDDEFLFTFTSDASNAKAHVGSYPIMGSAAAQGETKESNYTIIFDGYFEGGKYGTYTITKRIIVVTINDQTAIYGGADGDTRIPTLDNTLYTAAYNGDTSNAILAGDEKSLQIRFTLMFNGESDLSTAGALKAGTYAIVGAYGVDNSHTNYEVSFVGGWTGEDGNHSQAGTFTVTRRGINVSLGLDGSLATSEYGATPQGPWTQVYSSMYLYALTTGTGHAIVAGDKIEFTMKALADEKSHVGTYPLVGELTEGDNDNGNYNFTFTGAFVDTEGGANETYNGIAGIYTVTPRKIKAEILAYTREYGEQVNNKAVLSALNGAGTDGLYFKLQEDWSVNGDTVSDLGVVLDCIAGEKDGAQTYTITGTAASRDYDVTFTGGEGKYTITPRVVYVVILPQVSVYGKSINVVQTMWYAYRNGSKATWSGGATLDAGHVLAAGEKLDDLNVRLTKRVAVDGYDYDEGNGIYGGQYAIEGDYSNANYKVIFVGANTKPFFGDTDAFKNTANPYYLYAAFTTSDVYDYADDPNGLLKKEFGESGIYTVAPRKVTIALNDISGTYGGKEHTLHGEPLKKGVQLDPAMGTVWKYDFNSEQIDAGHAEYLSFYLGGKFDKMGEDYLTVSDYPVVAYWGLGLGEKSRMRDWNYAITFHGEWSGSLDGNWADIEGHTPTDGLAGKYTVGNATIEQADDWYEAVDYILEYGAEPYTMSVNKSMTDVDPDSLTRKRHLAFKGDVTEATKITYGKLYFNKDRNTKEGVLPKTYDQTDPATGAPMVNDAGYWILEVTVEAKYHDTATFDLVYHITPDLIVLTLKEDAAYKFTYGDYRYDESGTYGQPFSALESALKEWLLGEKSVVSAMRLEGEYVGAEQLSEKIRDLFLQEEITVSVHKMASNMSTGGYLNAGRYLVTISGGDNLEITFVHDYEVITCEPKTVTATWTELTGDAVQSEYDGDGADLFTVTYDGRQHTLDPSVSGVLDGDLITDYAAASYRYDTASRSDGASATPLGYGYYVCRVTSRALGGADGSNYAVQDDLHAYVYVEKCDVTVEIKDKAHHTYGDTEPEFTASDWDISADSFMAQGEQRSVLGVVLTREGGKNVGTYKVTGTYSNDNYNVTWKGSWKAEGDPDSGKCGTFTIDPRPITVTLFDKTVTYGTALPAEDDLASDITLWYATYDRNPRGVAIIQGDDIHLTMKIGYTSADLTATGYLMAKSYTVKAGWDNGNYTVTFESDSTPSLATSLYIVGKRSLRVSLFDAAPTEYGYDRPESISHAFTGFTAEDQAYFNAHPEELFIRFFFYDPGKKMELSPAAKYDPVGIYAVCGEVTDKNDPIGSNYEVNFVGSWDDNTYPDLVQHAGVYRVTPRTISIIIHSVSSEYGEIAYVPIELQTGSSLVGSDTLEGLGIRYKTAAYYDGRTNKPGTYPIEYDSIANPNYRVSGAVSIDATYTVLKRKIKIVAGDQSGEYGDEHTVQSVQGVHWRAIWVTAEGEPREEGPGIAYEDDLINNLRLLCRSILTSTRVGSYPLSATYETDDRYEIIAEEYGNYQVLPREIVVHVESYNDWEYGEDHAARFRNQINIIDRGFYFERKNGSGDAIAFFSDPICNFHLALDVTAASHVGDYAITCVYSDSNYSVEIRGTYMDEDGNEIGGTYTIKPRKIKIVAGDQSGEYGDVHTLADRYGVTWTASRPAGGIAIIGTDDLKLTFTTNATEQSGVNGDYYITAVCGNEDYEVTFINGKYTVTPRKLTASVYGESEYGDPLQEMDLVLSRTTAGLGGPGIMPWDESFLTITASCAVEEGSPAGHYPVTYTINGELGANENYEIVNSNEGEYVVLPREIVVDIGSITRTYGDPIVEGSGLTYTVSRANGKAGEAILNGEIAIILRVLAFSRNAGVYTIDIQDIDNENYHVTVNTGEYTIEQKQITVHIDDKSSEYGSAVEALTVGEVEGLVEGDDLGLSLRVEWGDDLAWHNVGNYAIVGAYDNLNYLVTFDGSWAARDAVGGTYTVYKAANLWLKEYSGDGTVVQGNGLGEGEAPAAKFGETVIRYYYDAACTQEIEGDLAELGVGVYYAKATVGDTLNYGGVEAVFAVEVLSSFIYPNGALDVTLFVSIFASQFVVGICALLFVRRRKNKKNQS